MEYEEIEPSSRAELAAALVAGEAAHTVQVLLGVVLNDSDPEWLQEKCLELLEADDVKVQRAAALGLSHIARVHRRMDVERVEAALRATATQPELTDYVEVVLEDIALLVGDGPRSRPVAE